MYVKAILTLRHMDMVSSMKMQQDDPSASDVELSYLFQVRERKLVEGEKSQAHNNGECKGNKVVDQGEGEGFGLPDTEKSKSEDAGIMPVSDETGRSRNGNSYKKNDHERQGCCPREGETEGQKQEFYGRDSG